MTFQVTNTGASTLTVTANGVDYTLTPGQVGVYKTTIAALTGTETAVFVKSSGNSSATVIATPTTTGLALGQVSANVTFSSGATTPVFSIDKVASNGTTADTSVVKLTFTKNVSVNNVTVIYGSGTVAAVQSDAVDPKVIRATFADKLVSGTANDTFKVSYAGKVYTFKLLANGTFQQI